MVEAKKQKDIKQELDQKKKEGDASTKKALELSKLAEKTKATLEGMRGEATDEAAKGMENAAAAFQGVVEAKFAQAEQKSQEIHDDLEEDQQEFSQGVAADKADLQKLGSLKSEAKKAGVETSNIENAEKAKQQEVKFLDAESKSVEKSQQEMQKALKDSQQRRQAAKFTYKSKNTLGS